MSLRRSSCRILSWLLRAGKVRMGPPRLSLPPANRHVHLLRHHGGGTWLLRPVGARHCRRPAPRTSERPAPPLRRDQRWGHPRGEGVPEPCSFLQRVCSSLLQFCGWRGKKATFTCFLRIKPHLLTPLCLLPLVSLRLLVSLSLVLFLIPSL